MGKPIKVDPKLYEVASPDQKIKLRAIEQYGGIRAAARALNIDNAAVSRTHQTLIRRAALYGHSPEHDMTKTVPEGFAVKGVSSYYNKEGVLAGQWVKSKIDDAKAEQILRDFIADLAEGARGKSPSIKAPIHCSADFLSVYPMGDPHFGMYAWGAETGADFDTEKAEALTTSAIDRLVDSSPPSETAVVLPLGDFFHADDTTSRTPNSGHALDVDTRWPRVMQIGLRALVYCVKKALAKHARVFVRVVRGNHDHHAAFGLALALDAYFSNESRVSVDLSPSPMWYFRFGRVLIGSTHGDMAKVSDMPGIMAFDRAEDWGQTKHRYWYLGHVHHQAVQEFPGVVVEQFRTLAARDAWHAGMGYRAGRDMCLIVHHKDHGEVERHRVDIGQLT